MNDMFMIEEADMFYNPLRTVLHTVQAWVNHRPSPLAASLFEIDGWSHQSAVALLEEPRRHAMASQLWLNRVQHDGACL